MPTLYRNKKILNIIAHIAAWAFLFSVPIITTSRPTEEFVTSHFFVHFICTYIFLVFFYYLNTLILIPRLLLNNKWGWYVVSILVCLVAFAYIPREIATYINGTDELFARKLSDKDKELFKKNRILPFTNFSAMFFWVYTIGTCIAVVQRLYKTENIKKEVENEKLNTELSFLKSQVNPHFFFNTLNNIYSLAVVQSDKTAPAVMKLSSIMRYILTDTQQNVVPLDNEIAFLTNYIDLQLVRLTDKVKVDFVVTGDTSQITVAPLLFISFVENAFKYGVSTKENSAINIDITTEGKIINLTVTNTIVKSLNNMPETTGIGINNVKRRLELSYEGKHQLNVTEHNNVFKVQLQIDTTI